MIIGGLQKMTMLDFPGKVACTIFTQGCNFKCPFCHNRGLVVGQKDIITEEEIFAYLKKRVGILDGACVTGGEPLLQKDIFEFLKKIKDTGLLVKLDTNGYLPDKLRYAIENGLVDYVAMDIKNCPDKYAQTSGVDNLDIENIKESVNILKEGKVPYEFRTTVTKELHTKEDLKKIGEWICGAEAYYIQNYRDSENVLCKGLSSLENQELNALLNAVLPYVPAAALRGI